MKLAICASAAFYTNVIDYSYTLEDAGFDVVLPKTAANMKAGKLDHREIVSDWNKHPQGYHGKALLIRGHFTEIEKSDAILVMNFEKHETKNYIGPNVLMEMSTAFYLQKPIYVLNGVPEESPLIDEILGLEPIFLDGDLDKIKY